MTTESRINLIMHGLPSELRKQIDRKDIENVDSLMNKLSIFEPPAKGHRQSEKNGEKFGKKIVARQGTSESQTASDKRNPCGLRESLGFSNRFHAENKCWNKPKARTSQAKVNLNEDLDQEENLNEQKN